MLTPVVTDPREAAKALRWAVMEMEERYIAFEEARVRDLKGYNDKAKKEGKELLPYIVIVIDELADLMMVASAEVEEAICRLSQSSSCRYAPHRCHAETFHRRCYRSD